MNYNQESSHEAAVKAKLGITAVLAERQAAHEQRDWRYAAELTGQVMMELLTTPMTEDYKAAIAAWESTTSSYNSRITEQ